MKMNKKEHEAEKDNKNAAIWALRELSSLYWELGWLVSVGGGLMIGLGAPWFLYGVVMAAIGNLVILAALYKASDMGKLEAQSKLGEKDS